MLEPIDRQKKLAHHDHAQRAGRGTPHTLEGAQHPCALRKHSTGASTRGRAEWCWWGAGVEVSMI